MPDNMSPYLMGKNFKERTFMRNSFDATEQVKYRVSFKKFPKSGPSQNQDPDRGWVTRHHDDPVLEFPKIALRNITMATQGSYHIRIGDQYITDIRRKEVSDYLDNLLGENEGISWEDFDMLCADLPEGVDVHFIDQTYPPENWDSNLFGMWHPRRLIFLGVPSRHSPNKVHKAVIAYVPTSWELPENFTNRLGFVQDGLDRVLEWGCMGKDCRVGYRLNSCCAHITAALLLLAVYGQGDVNQFASSHRPYHLLDIGNIDYHNQILFAQMPPSDDEDSN